MEEWNGRDDANTRVRAVMMEARAARTQATAQDGERKDRSRGGEVMGELASLRETLAPFQGRDEVEKLQSELARLRESAQEAAKRIAEAGSSRSTPTMRDGHHRQGTPSHPAVTAEHRQGTGGVQHHTDQELGCSADLVYGKEDGRFEPMMGSRTADADQVGVLGEGGSRTGAGDSADSQHQRHQQQEREQEGSPSRPSGGEDPGGSAIGPSPKDQKAKLQEDLTRLRELSAQIKAVPSRTGPEGRGPTAKRDIDTMLSDIKSQLRGLASPGQQHAAASPNGGAYNKLSSARAAVQDDLSRLRRQLESVRPPPKSEVGVGEDAAITTKGEDSGDAERGLDVEEGGVDDNSSCEEAEVEKGGNVEEVEVGVGVGGPRGLSQAESASSNFHDLLDSVKGSSKAGSRRGSCPGSVGGEQPSRSEDCTAASPLSELRKSSLIEMREKEILGADPDDSFVRNQVNESVLTIAFREFSGKDSLGVQGVADINVLGGNGLSAADKVDAVHVATTRVSEENPIEVDSTFEGLGLFKGWLVAGPCGLFYGIRTLVSGKKYRFQEDGFDLDLTYVTPQVIAMAYPAEKTLVERASRNHIDEVLTFFKKKHSGKCKIFNLIKETNVARYDLQRFKNEGFPVTREYCFYDHSVPPIDVLIEAVDEMNMWIQGGRDRVAAVHCKAGKGRTGLLVCCYLADVNRMNATEAMLEYGLKRMKDGNGLTVPSQRRWVQYYVSRNEPIRTCNLKIKHISFKEGIFGRMYGRYKLMVHVHKSSLDIVDGEVKRSWALALAFCSDTVQPNENGDVVFKPFENTVISDSVSENGLLTHGSRQLQEKRSLKKNLFAGSNDGLVVDGGFCITICMRPRDKFVHGPSCWLHARHLPEEVFLTTSEWDRITQSNGIRNSDIHPKTGSSACAWEVKVCSEPTDQSNIPLLGQTL